MESESKNVSVCVDVDLSMFRRQATTGTSDDIDHRCIYASPELNFYNAGADRNLYHISRTKGLSRGIR